jgi:hypothetical protein
MTRKCFANSEPLSLAMLKFIFMALLMILMAPVGSAAPQLRVTGRSLSESVRIILFYCESGFLSHKSYLLDSMIAFRFVIASSDKSLTDFYEHVKKISTKSHTTIFLHKCLSIFF